MLKDLLLVAIAPVILMVYGFYLGSLGQSMVDLAGIIMLVIGVIALVFSVIAYFLIRPKKWYYDVLLGISGVVLVFIGVVIYARING